MTNYSLPNNSIYSLAFKPSKNQAIDNMGAYLCKAEALATVAATTDFETFKSEIISNYLWTLSEEIREARKLYKLIFDRNKINQD